MSENKKKVLILLEHEAQVADCARWFGDLEGEKKIIALTPFAMYELDERQLPYAIPEDYYSPDELYELGIENFSRVEELCAVVDKAIHESYPRLAELGITPALFSFYHLKIIYDAVTIALFQLNKILEREQPDTVMIYATKQYPFGPYFAAPYLLFDNRESLYASLLIFDSWTTGVQVLPYVPEPPNAFCTSVEGTRSLTEAVEAVKQQVLPWLLNHPRFYRLVREIKRDGWKGFARLSENLVAENTSRPVLQFGGDYNWRYCREEFLKQGIDPVYELPDDLRWLRRALKIGVPKNLFAGWDQLTNHQGFRRFFIEGRIDFFPLLEPRIRFLFQHLSLTCLLAFNEAKTLIHKKGIKAVIASTLATCAAHSVPCAARRQGIPVVTWQHGAYGTTPHPIVHYCDLISSNVHLVFGTGVTCVFRDAASKYGTQLIPVGSTMLDKLTKERSSAECEKIRRQLLLNKKVIVYVTTNYYQSNLSISTYPPLSDNLLWLTLRAIMDTLGQQSDYDVVIKLHPSRFYREQPLKRYAEHKHLDHWIFIRDEIPFDTLLSCADAIICDFPSTTLLQALTTSKPVFVYLGYHNMEDSAREILERRAICRTNLLDFTEALAIFLTSGVMGTLNLEDKEFLEMYGISTSDGAASERVTEVLKELIKAGLMKSAFRLTVR